MLNKVEDLNKKILIDSDVIRHFIKGKSTDKLSKIFPNNMYIIDIVEAEICRSKYIKPIVQELINNKTLNLTCRGRGILFPIFGAFVFLIFLFG